MIMVDSQMVGGILIALLAMFALTICMINHIVNQAKNEIMKKLEHAERLNSVDSESLRKRYATEENENPQP